MNKRTQQALQHLQEGAEFCVRLEDGFAGRRHYRHRLVKKGKVIPGFGFRTFNVLRGRLVPTSASTSVSTYYRLRG